MSSTISAVLLAVSLSGGVAEADKPMLPQSIIQAGLKKAQCSVPSNAAEIVGAGCAARRARSAGPGMRPMRALARLAVGVDEAGIELAPLFGIAQDREGRVDQFDPLFGGLAIVGIEIGVEFLRQLAVGTPDLVVGRRARYAKFDIGVIRHGPAIVSSPLVL